MKKELLIIFSILTFISCKNEVKELPKSIDFIDYFRIQNESGKETKYFELVNDSDFIKSFKVDVKTIDKNPLEIEYTFFRDSFFIRSKEKHLYYNDGITFKSYSMFIHSGHSNSFTGYDYIETKAAFEDSTKLFSLKNDSKFYSFLLSREDYGYNINVNITPRIDTIKKDLLGYGVKEYLVLNDKNDVKIDYKYKADTSFSFSSKYIYEKHKGLVYFEEEHNQKIYKYKLAKP